MYRAKFTCKKNVLDRDHLDNTPSVGVYLTAVDNEATEENATFWRATAAGQIQLQITPEASAHFVEGTDYYVDFTAVA